MLSSLRGAMSGWVAKIFLALLVLSFAVWGISGSMFQGVGNAVITVGETRVEPVEFRLAFDRQINQASQQFGTRLTREQAAAFGLEQSVISQLVSGAILDEAAREMGLGMSRDRLAGMIAEDEAFRDATGRFSRGQLRSILNSIGMSEEQYVETRRAVAIRGQIISAAAAETSMPDAFYEYAKAYEGEKRTFEFVTISDDDIEPVANPLEMENGEETLREWFADNQTRYVAPEFRKLTVLKLEATDIADPEAVSEEEARQDYESRMQQFSEPERRTVEQLVFADPQAAEDAASKLEAGTTFETLLEDEGKTPQDVSLGKVRKSDIPDPAIADTAFSLAEGETSEPVKGLFGTVILRVTEIEEGSIRPFEDVEPEIRQALALQNAADDLFDTFDRIEDERAAGLTLSEAAQAVGLMPRVIEAVDRQAMDADGNVIADIPQSRELLAEAFETDPGVEADPLQIGSDGFVWYEVESVTDERQKSFEEVRDAVAADWRSEQISAKIEELAEAIRERLASGEAFETVVGSLPNVAESSNPEASTDTTEAPETPMETTSETDSATATPADARVSTRVVQFTPPLTRSGSTEDFPQNAVTAGFMEPEGGVLVADAQNGAAKIVFKVAAITQEMGEVSEEAIESVNQIVSDDIVSQLIARLREDNTVEINRALIDAVLAQ